MQGQILSQNIELHPWLWNAPAFTPNVHDATVSMLSFSPRSPKSTRLCIAAALEYSSSSCSLIEDISCNVKGTLKKSSLSYVAILASYITFILLRVKMGLRVFLTSLQLCPPFKVKRFDLQIMSLYEVPLSQFIPPMFLSSKWSKSLTIEKYFWCDNNNIIW